MDVKSYFTHYLRKNVRTIIQTQTRYSGYPAETFPLPLATTLCHLLVPKAGKQADQKVVQYAPRYRLAFTLLNEDTSAGGAMRGWEADVSVESAYGGTLGAGLLTKLSYFRIYHANIETTKRITQFYD
jgi:hypothetical protein